jgi:hypothetical protein
MPTLRYFPPLNPNALKTASHCQAAKMVLTVLESVLKAERVYMGNIPEPLKESCVYDTAEETVSALEEAIALLKNAYGTT